MAKKKGTAVATPEQLADKWKAHLPDGLTEKQFDAVCVSLRKRIEEAGRMQRENSHKIMSLYWKTGDEMREKLFQGTDKPKQKAIDELAILLGTSSSTIRRSVGLRDMYTHDEVVERAKEGLHMGHIEHLLAVEDVKLRKKLERQIIDGNLATEDAKKLVTEATKNNLGALSPASRARRKQVETKRKADAENPVKAIPHARMKLKDLVESVGGLVVALGNIRSMEADEQLKLLPEILELKEEFSSQTSLIQDVLVELGTLINGLEAAKASKSSKK